MGIRMNSNSVEWVCLRIPETGKVEFDWSGTEDLNLRSPGPEPHSNIYGMQWKTACF